MPVQRTFYFLSPYPNSYASLYVLNSNLAANLILTSQIRKSDQMCIKLTQFSNKTQ